jgi:hypothetical protein
VSDSFNLQYDIISDVPEPSALILAATAAISGLVSRRRN